jgi:lysozyme
MKTSKKGLDLIKKFEGLHDGDLKKTGLQPKMCPAGIWTVGYGYALVNKKTGKWIKGQSDYPLILEQYPELETMTEKQAEEQLAEIIKKYERIVLNKVKIKLTQHQFDALVSHTFNTGGSNGLFKLINEGAKESAIRD